MRRRGQLAGRWAARSAAQRMELTGGADCGALGGDEKSERVEEEVASGGSVRVERWVRPLRGDSTALRITIGVSVNQEDFLGGKEMMVTCHAAS